MSEEFDLFEVEENLPLEQQRAFELFWKKYTGRSAIVIGGGVKYSATLSYPEGSSE